MCFGLAGVVEKTFKKEKNNGDIFNKEVLHCVGSPAYFRTMCPSSPCTNLPSAVTTKDTPWHCFQEKGINWRHCRGRELWAAGEGIDEPWQDLAGTKELLPPRKWEEHPTRSFNPSCCYEGNKATDSYSFPVFQQFHSCTHWEAVTNKVKSMVSIPGFKFQLLYLLAVSARGELLSFSACLLIHKMEIMKAFTT